MASTAGGTSESAIPTSTSSPRRSGNNNAAATGNNVACLLAVDGGERLAKEWPALAVGYITAILRQLSNIHPGADIQVAPMVINSLPPSSRRPLIVRPFRPISQAMAELPSVLGNSVAAAGKGKQREVTSDQDYALLEGLFIASSLLDAQKANQSYLILVSAQDIANTNFWDEDLPNGLPIASAWPDIGPSTGMAPEAFQTSEAWQRLIEEMTKCRVHFCTITTRFLPRLEDFQRKVAAAKNYSSQSLPNLQNSEHAILLSGFQQAPTKRPHADSVTASPRDGRDRAMTNGPQQQNKRAKLSPKPDAKQMNSVAEITATNEPVKAQPQPLQTQTQSQDQPQNQFQPPSNGQAERVQPPAPSQFFEGSRPHLPIPQDPATLQMQQQQSQQQQQQQQMSNSMLLAFATGQNGPQGAPLDLSAIFQQQQLNLSNLNTNLIINGNGNGGGNNMINAEIPFSQQPQHIQIQDLVQEPFSISDLHTKREEVKSQMKQFLTSLSSMAKAKQLSMEQARATAEQVRNEAVKKLQLLDLLEERTGGRPPTRTISQQLSQVIGNEGAALQMSPSFPTQPLQNSTPASGGGLPLPSPNLPQQQNSTSQLQQTQQQAKQVPQQQQQQQGSQQRQQANQQSAMMNHGRTLSVSSSTPNSNHQQTPSQVFSQLGTNTTSTPASSTQSLPAQGNKQQQQQGKQPGSPNRAAPVWSGPIQWSLVDPQTKQKRELAFYVDAVPMRPNAAVELANIQWPSTLEIAHITGMPMSELQKYASDNRIQVMQFVKAASHVVESLGMSQGQNDSLYKLLAKSLEDKGSVATIKLPGVGQNRGIVVVALPGQSKLVGLLFLHTSLPPRTPSVPSSDQIQQQQQQQQQLKAPAQVQSQPQPQRPSHQRSISISKSQDMQTTPVLTQAAIVPPQPSPSLTQQGLQPFLQQMQMPAQFQQPFQNMLPNMPYGNMYPLQAPQEQFNSPGFSGQMSLPGAFPMAAHNNANNTTSGFPADKGFNFSIPQMQGGGQGGSTAAQPMSDAQFQELLASLQKA